MKLSVVVCTTNQRKELEKCLLSINPSGNTELLVVNNSFSKITTKSKARVITEGKPGLSRARNTGWQKARGEYVAYIDDDAIASPNWIRQIVHFIAKHPSIEVFGGLYHRHSEYALPGWMPRNYGTKDCGNTVRRLKIGRDLLNGTNMIFKRTLLEKMGGFNESYGMVGNQIYYGEETELQLRLAREGIAVWYDPKICVSHLIPRRKMNWGWIMKEAFITGQATELMKNIYKDIFRQTDKHRSFPVRIQGNFGQKATRIVQLAAYLAGWHYQRITKS